MKRGLYRKMGWSNIRKNYRFFVPRITSEAGLLACFYISLTLAFDDRLSQVKGGTYIPTFMLIGTAVLAILSAVLMFYTNSFLMKQRRAEFGVYNILGMEKKHVGKVLFHESFLSSIISILGGLGLGVLFYKLCSLLICKLLKSKIIVGFYFITPKTLALAGAFFILLDILTFIYNRIVISRMKPVEMLKSRSAGEKEPTVKWLLLLVGIAALGAGYFISITTKSPLQALELFFVAVVLVIIGTYCIFVTGTTFVLKLLKKNERYYYNKKHMPSVSGLLFRMKQNAVGLASIAILATGVLVMISTTVSLYSGLQGTLDKNYPQDLYFYAQYENTDGVNTSVPAEELERMARKAADDVGVKIESVENNDYLSVSYYKEGNRLYTKNEVENTLSKTEIMNGIVDCMFITEASYTALTGETLSLGRYELGVSMVSSPTGNSKDADMSGELVIHGKTYKIAENIGLYPVKTQILANGFPVMGFVVADDEAMKEIFEAQKAGYGKYASEMTNRICVSFVDREKACKVGDELTSEINSELNAYLDSIGYGDASAGYSIDTYWEAREEVTGMYGTLLFLGILLGAVCLFATVLIIYYKQISEGYEDRDRFQIMEKIGMTTSEIKKTINSQVLLVFFLPLIVAGIHIVFAYPMLSRMLRVLALYKPTLFLTCSLISYAVFAVVYILIYLGTSRTYYKIIK